MYNTYVVKFLLTVSIAVVITRFIILLLPTKYSKAPLLQEFNRFFPAVILSLLIIYSVKDAQWNIKMLKSVNFAYAEIIGIATTALVHVVAKRKVLLSISAGTLAYILMQSLQNAM